MPLCYYCQERPRAYFAYYCDDCANLRRMLLIYSPDKCIDILKRTLTRDDKQIDFKINQEIKKILNKEIEDTRDDKETDDETDKSYMTRSKNKK